MQPISQDIIICPTVAVQPARLFTPTPKAAERVLEFFTAQINNDQRSCAPEPDVEKQPNNADHAQDDDKRNTYPASQGLGNPTE